MKRSILTTTICLAAAVQCAAHGTHTAIETNSRIVVASYDDGSPMDYCDASVFSPASSDEPWLTGTTDPNGRFAFCPDTQGVWRVTVDDGMGHRVRVDVDCDETAPVARDKHSHNPPVSRPVGLLIGIAMILGIFGAIATFKRRGPRCTSPKA